MRVGGVPFDQGKHPRTGLTPTAVVLHRTYGSWAGDYSIGKSGRGKEPIGFHFLIGEDEGRWVQFYDTTVRCNHAAGANDWSVGVEIEGRNEDRLTDWQVRAACWILTAVTGAHNIPRTYTVDGRRRKLHGVLPHSLVPGSTHTDMVSMADWGRIFPAPPSVTLPVRPVLTLGASGPPVEWLRWELAVITGRGPEMTLDGASFGLRIVHVLQDLQRLLGKPGWGDCTTVTTDMWAAIDYLYASLGHMPVSS